MGLLSLSETTPCPGATLAFWDRSHSVYRVCISLNKPAFTLLLLTLEFFPVQIQAPSLGGPSQGLTWDLGHDHPLVSHSPATSARQEKPIKGTWNGQEEIKIFLFSGDMILYLANLRESMIKLTLMIKVFRGLPGGPVGKTPCSQWRGPGVRSLVRELDPACMPQLRVCTPKLKAHMPQLRPGAAKINK